MVGKKYIDRVYPLLLKNVSILCRKFCRQLGKRFLFEKKVIDI